MTAFATINAYQGITLWRLYDGFCNH